MIVLPNHPTPEVSILIVTNRQPELLENCLQSIEHHFPTGIAAEVVIVINGATDAVRLKVRDTCRGAVLAESTANLGLAGGYNLARSLARGRLLLLLHDDAELLPGSVDALLATLKARPEAGAVGSRLLNADGSHQIAGAVMWGNAWTTHRTFDPSETASFPVDYVTLCGTLTPADAWDAVGGLDEAIYPGFYVDTDYSTSLWASGRPVFCEPASTMIHRGGASKNLAFATFLSQRNRPYFAKKWAARLRDQEPWALDDPDAESRARARTEERAQRRKITLLPSREPLSTAADRDLKHLRQALRLYEDWSHHLKAETISARAEADELRRHLKAAYEELERKCESAAREREKKIALSEKITSLKAKIKKLQEEKARPRCDWRFWRWGRG
jgi:GT2 family glycosyltransferase